MSEDRPQTLMGYPVVYAEGPILPPFRVGRYVHCPRCGGMAGEFDRTDDVGRRWLRIVCSKCGEFEH